MSRSESEIFEAFKEAHSNDGTRWREWWMKYWMDHIGDYFERKWKLIPVGKFSKRPLAGFNWSKRSLDFEEVVWYAAGGYNIAVVAEDLSILDRDSSSVKPFETGTLTMITPKGHQYFTVGNPTERDQSLAKKLGFDTIRHGVMFSLVPLSRTCSQDRGGSCRCLVHDFRFREWANFGAQPLPLRKVLRDLA